QRSAFVRQLPRRPCYDTLSVPLVFQGHTRGVLMPSKPWRATCIQMSSKVASEAASRDEAWRSIRANLDKGSSLIEKACSGPLRPKLVVLPEFAFQGPPRTTPTSSWIERACATIPGPITDQLAEVAKRHNIYIAGNHFEVDPRWPDRYFN